MNVVSVLSQDLIITGRPVTGKEAFEMGLCNRLTSCGTAVGKAIQLANSIAKFPQECMNKDRMSAYNSVYSSSSFEDAVRYEMENGMQVIRKVRIFKIIYSFSLFMRIGIILVYTYINNIIYFLGVHSWCS